MATESKDKATGSKYRALMADILVVLTLIATGALVAGAANS